jgi:hypothetical protein
MGSAGNGMGCDDYPGTSPPKQFRGQLSDLVVNELA